MSEKGKDQGLAGQPLEDRALKSAAALFGEELLPLRKKGLSGAVYTQLTDIEEEVNGLITYDRKIVKIPFPQTSPSASLPHESTPESEKCQP